MAGITPFQALTVSLASRVGTGNLAGVAVALYLGGPGAIFWMWMVALVGMATAYAESTLAQLYKVKNADVIAPGSFDECTSPECYTRTQHSNWWSDDLNVPIRELVPADPSDFYMNAKEWAYRISALWQPENEKMALNLSFQHFRNDSAGGVDLVNCEKLRGRPTYLLDEDNQIVLNDDGDPIKTGTNDCSNIFPADDTYQAVVNVPGRLRLDIMYLRAKYHWDLSDRVRFIYSAGFEDQDRESQQDMEQSLNAWDQALFFLPGTGSQSWMHELQLQYQGADKFNWILGANFFREKTSTIGFFDNTIDEKAFYDQPNRGTKAGAIFAQGTYSFNEKWHMTLGVRYSDETKEDKGGQSFICNVANGCASSDIPAVTVNGSLMGFDRETLNSYPTDYFATR